jgi:hypothetical protein
VTTAQDSDMAAQVAAAGAANLVILALGNHPYCSDNAGWMQCDSPNEGREAIDRKFIAVEPAQITLAQQVFAANPEHDRRHGIELPAGARPGSPTTRRPSSTSRTRARSWAPRSPTCCSATTIRPAAPR